MFALRFDIDSHYGLTKKTEPLLQLLDEFGLKATFFCVMGEDPGVREVIDLLFRKRAARPTAARAPAAARAPRDQRYWAQQYHRLKRLRRLPKIVHTLLRQRNVGSGNPAALRRIVDAGHDLYPHGWSHIQWQRNLEHIDIRLHLARCIDAYRDILGTAPAGFGSPGRVWNSEALALFDELGLRILGDMDGEQPFTWQPYQGLQIPVTLFRTIYQMRAEGLNQDAIVERYCRHVSERPFSVIYEHPDNLFDFEFTTLRRFFERLRAAGIRSHRFSEVYAAYRADGGQSA